MKEGKVFTSFHCSHSESERQQALFSLLNADGFLNSPLDINIVMTNGSSISINFLRSAANIRTRGFRSWVRSACTTWVDATWGFGSWDGSGAGGASLAWSPRILEIEDALLDILNCDVTTTDSSRIEVG